MRTLERSQLIPVPREVLFAFFEDPRNLGDITPPKMGFDILKMDELPIPRGSGSSTGSRCLACP